MRRVEHALWRDVDAIYYPSAAECEAVRAVVPDALALPLPIFNFDEPPLVEGPSGRRDVLFVAGFGHSPNVDAAVWLVKDIFPTVRAASPDPVGLWLVGSNPTDEVTRLAGEAVTVTGYVTDDALHRFYATARVAVVPLRVGAGVKGKVIEALHFGVPLVTTSVGAQGLDGLPTVVVVSDDAQVIAQEISKLLQDDERWRDASRRQQAYISGRFSPEAMRRALRQGLDTGHDLPAAADGLGSAR